jgi:hypothetical protein
VTTVVAQARLEVIRMLQVPSLHVQAVPAGGSAEQAT